MGELRAADGYRYRYRRKWDNLLLFAFLGSWPALPLPVTRQVQVCTCTTRRDMRHVMYVATVALRGRVMAKLDYRKHRAWSHVNNNNTVYSSE
jgi:hypothetical protein